VFGPPYVKLFGRERLLSAPVANVRELAPDTIRLQLTEDVAAVSDDPEAFEEARERVQRHLGKEAFFDSSRQAYRVPPELLRPERAPQATEASEPDERLAAEMEEMAEAFASVGREKGYALDYSEESVELLDRVISEVFGDPADEEGRADDSFFDNMTPTIGAYLGTVMVHRLDGHWTRNDDEPCVVVDGLWTYPIVKVEKRFLNGYEDSLAFFYHSIKHLTAGELETS
jgi:cytochrome P450